MKLASRHRGMLAAALTIILCGSLCAATGFVDTEPDGCVMFCEDSYRYTGGEWQPYTPPGGLPRVLFKNFPEIYSDTAYTWHDCNIVIRCVFAKPHRQTDARLPAPLLHHHVDSDMVKWVSDSADAATRQLCMSERFPRFSVADIDSLMSDTVARRHTDISDGDMLTVQYFLPDSCSEPLVLMMLNNRPMHF